MTSKHHQDVRAILSCMALSLLAHFAVSAPLDFFKSFELGPPVLQQSLLVDLQENMATAPTAKVALSLPVAAAPSEDSVPQEDEQTPTIPAEESRPGKVETQAPLLPAQQTTIPEPVEMPAESATSLPAEENGEFFTVQRVNAVAPPPIPLRNAAEFLSSDWEKLSYRVSMMGIPVGTAELEARQEKGELRITLHIRSNATISQLYPVDDSVETRHIGGNFILSRIRQQEGSFRGDRGFTLFLREKSVFWIDRLKNLSLREPLPNSDVVDILSGLYYLRNQPLEVGKTVLLELFDSNRYAPTTVAVLRKEHLALPGLRDVDTLLVHPQLKTDGFFQRTGEILVWLSDDQNRVPVKVETRISLGKVTAELISAQTHRHGEPPSGDTVRIKTGPVATP